MPDNVRMSSQVGYTRENVNDRLAGPIDQPLMYRSRSEEENRSRGSNGHDTASPTAFGNGGVSNGQFSRDSRGRRRESAPTASSHAFFAPPATPSPQYGFRRNTANAMAAGRRLSHRSSSVPGLGGDGQELDQGVLSVDAGGGQLPGPRLTNTAAADIDVNYDAAFGRPSREARPSSNGGRDGGYTGSTAPGTLPGSSGNSHKLGNPRKYGGDRIFQMDDEEVAAALLEETPSPAVDVYRHTGYRNSAQGSKTRSASAPVPSESGGVSPQLLSPSVGRADSEPPATVDPVVAVPVAAAVVEAKPRREKKSGKEEMRRRRGSSRRTRATSSGVPSSANPEANSQPMASPTSAWFAGMSAAQQERFESLQERSSAGHEMARWKMLELMRHWMSTQGTRSSVDAAIREVLVDAGLARAKEAWGSGGTSSQRVAAMANLPQNTAGAALAASATAASAKSASPPSCEPLPEKVSPKSQLIAKAASGAALDDAASKAEAPPPPAQAEAIGAATGKPKAEVPVTSSSLPQLNEGAASNSELRASSPSAAEVPTLGASPDEAPTAGATPPAASPDRRRVEDRHAVVAGARDKGPVTPSPVAPPPVAKENSAVLRREDGVTGELPPIATTPEKQMAPEAHATNGASPDSAGTPTRADASPEKTSIAKPFSGTTTPARSPPEPTMRSPRASETALRRSRSANNLLEESTKRLAATYDEIPRFYFPLGRPTTREQVINGPLSKKHENPHLKVVDGVTIAATMYDGEGSAMLNAGAEVLVGGSSDDGSLPAEAHHGPKMASMSNLHIVEDRQVSHYIQREFGRLPPFPKHSSKVRLLGGRARNGSHHSSHLPYAKQELLYKQQFIQCVQRICSQCFGVPRYFAFIILRLIQWEVNNGAADATGEGGRLHTRLASGSRMSSSSSLLSHTTTGSRGASSGALPSLFHITSHHLKDFHDARLRNKDVVRRVFDLLILSSLLSNSPAATASLAATNAAAGTVAANGRVDGATSRNLDATTLRPYLLPQDFVAYIDVLLTQHPGLAFLRQTPDFQTKYLDTAIYRIYYELDRFDRGSIRYSELAASRLIDAFRQVDVAEDINSVLLFFSYEHFYVLYCRFWELDEDRDMLLAPEDLMRYAPEDVMNPIIVERVFSGVGRRLRCNVPFRIGYEDFVWFCLSEEDKSTPQAIRYWFRMLDLDGDGVLSVYELREFYDVTRSKIAQYVQEGLVTFEDVVCQVFDMMRCPEYRGLHLSDLLREPEAAAVALNMLTNVVRFLQFEQRDPFVSHQERLLGGLEQSAWDRFARLEYDRMALEADEEG